MLEDGRELHLPYIKRLPINVPLFNAATANGVEIAGDGEVFGLVSVELNCNTGNIYMQTYRRINLSELAAVIRPDGIDVTRILPEEMQSLQEALSDMNTRYAVYLLRERGRLSVSDRYFMKLARRAFKQDSDASR